ncbi:acetyltransferase [Dyadobacter sp. Leaf189]|uniref:acetyltransferase n=1 Tax=Dyadobacter sp. Leaf189 TaxID=1736295 RepID=UPI00070005F8|nr:acetyltransferase [Dyadobacter sp. Leaf189]KQS25492.1 acetyltransferase [Dyadobacter sp. Leaf189]
MLLYGAGGHAKVVYQMLLEQGFQVKAVFDDQFSSVFHYHQVTLYDPEIFPESLLLVAIGNNYARRAVAENVQHQFGKLIHKSALVGADANLGAGSMVFHRAIIQTEAQVGKHVIVNTGAIIEHECRLSDFVHVAPRATLCGNVRVGENTLLGAGCIVLPGISIGKNCIIGAGSVVTRNVPDSTTVAGNPARKLTY